MHPLVEFLNHGFLPFVGRSGEIRRLIDFWHSTIDAHALRAALLVGEAGVGKSRLIEELMPRVAEGGGAVVHVKFYPESSSPVAPLLAEGLWRSSVVRQVLKREPVASIPSVAAALRHLSKLRATLLIIEDLHLLGGAGIGELSSLLAMIADEPISLLCVARPVELEARGVVEPFLVEELELRGLAEPDLRGVWGTVFGDEADDGALRLLMETTRGNALALRSALRGAVSAGALVQERSTGRWSVIPSTFAGLLERNIDLLISGMAAHLNPEERAAAGMLASLGEIFARETAQEMLHNAEEMIATLLFKGIIVTSSTPTTPLPGEPSRHPLLAFTHSLVHRYFVDRAPADPLPLIRIMAAGLPLYSVLPFDLLAGRAHRVSAAPLQETRGAIERSLKANRMLDNGSSWELGGYTWRAAAHLLASCMGAWEQEEWKRLLAEIIYQRLASLRRSSPEMWKPLVNLYLDLTAPLDSEWLRQERLYALRFLCRLHWVRDGVECREGIDEIRGLLERYPELRYTDAYCYFLSYQLAVAVERDDLERQREIEREAEEIVMSERCSDTVRRGIKGMIGRSLILLFEDEQELRRRLASLDELSIFSGGDIVLEHLKISLYFHAGSMEKVLETASTTVPRLGEQGLLRSFYDCKVMALCAGAALGLGDDHLITEGMRLCELIPEAIAGKLRPTLATHLVNTAILCGDPRGARTPVERYLREDHLPDLQRLLVSLAEGGDSAARLLQAGLFAGGSREASDLHLLTRSILDDTAGIGADAAGDAARRLLGLRVFRLDSLVTYRATLDLILLGVERHGPDFGASLDEDVRQSLRDVLGWLAERRLGGWMQSLLAQFGDRLPEKERSDWRRRCASLVAGQRLNNDGPRSDGRLRLTMLGTIAVAEPGAEPQQIRGARLRVLLGLMVANEMQRKPLDREEFWQLAGGGEDVDRARRTMHQGILRLREQLGRDAVLTDSDVPRLNLDRIHVDLLEAHRLLGSALDAARAGGLLKARLALGSALDLMRSAPFPTLYDEIFEALREEFENRLRDAIIVVGRDLLREGDAASAGEIFERGLGLIPEDEEMADLLRGALERQGKYVEAARLRMRMVME